MSEEEKELLKEYDSHEGFGAVLYLLLTVCLFLAFVGAAGLYCLISSCF